MATAHTYRAGERYIPEVGRHEGVDDDTYHREWKALNNSTLSNLKRSPAFCRWQMDHPTEDTAAFEFGKAVHCAILEPDRFSLTYQLSPQCPEDRNPRGWHNTNDYKAAKADLLNRGHKLLSQSDFDAVRRIRDNLYGAPSAARDLLEHMTSTEVSYVADCPETGLRCKVRPDIEVPAGNIAADLKTSSGASPDSFARSIYQYGYHRSKAHYLDTLNAEGSHQWEQYLFLVVEKTAPYEFAVYDLEPFATELGRREVSKLKALYKQCEERDEWPGYNTEIQSVGVPEWAYRAEELEEENESE
jgi:hypothetical protein